MGGGERERGSEREHSLVEDAKLARGELIFRLAALLAADLAQSTLPVLDPTALTSKEFTFDRPVLLQVVMMNPAN